VSGDVVWVVRVAGNLVRNYTLSNKQMVLKILNATPDAIGVSILLGSCKPPHSSSSCIFDKSLASLIDGAIEIVPPPFDFDIRLIHPPAQPHRPFAAVEGRF
jgi:hypothetical protein